MTPKSVSHIDGLVKEGGVQCVSNELRLSLTNLKKVYVYGNRYMCFVYLVYYKLQTDINSLNVALYKPAMQSSNYLTESKTYLADWTVDDNTDLYQCHCSCTGKHFESWWAVDLGARFTVVKTYITNRQDYFIHGISMNKEILNI